MSNKTKPKLKSAAVLTVIDAPEMSPAGRRRIAQWLRRQADMLVKDGKSYTQGRFRARYLYED